MKLNKFISFLVVWNLTLQVSNHLIDSKYWSLILFGTVMYVYGVLENEFFND